MDSRRAKRVPSGLKFKESKNDFEFQALLDGTRRRGTRTRERCRGRSRLNVSKRSWFELWNQICVHCIHHYDFKKSLKWCRSSKLQELDSNQRSQDYESCEITKLLHPAAFSVHMFGVICRYSNWLQDRAQLATKVRSFISFLMRGWFQTQKFISKKQRLMPKFVTVELWICQ